MTNKHSGSTFDSFLEEAGIKQDVETVAVKRVLAWQFTQAMAEKHKTKVDMAKELHTSRSQLERLLDPNKLSVTLGTISKAARVLGKKVTLQITDVHDAATERPSVSFRSVAQGEQVRCSRTYVLDHTPAWANVSIDCVNRAVLVPLSSAHVISWQECQSIDIEDHRGFLSSYEENSGLELALSA
jgi:antitoxin HicB